MIHQYKLGGYNIVLDVCSGAVHAVDDVAYDMIAAFESADRAGVISAIAEKHPNEAAEGIAECYDQIAELKAAGELFAPDTFEPMAGALKAKTAGVIKALCLHVAHTCNLSCSYCFASQGKYYGERAIMSYEVGKRALDFLVENSGTRHNLEVDFFGGEPLMNFDVVKQLVAYARSIEKEKGKNFRFTLTTNGVLIDDDVIDFANKEMSNVVLSLDGRKEIHDRFRVDYAGNGSWEKIVPKFQRLVNARGGKGFKEGREEDLIGRGPCFVINDNDDFFRLFRPEILSEGSVPRWGCKHPAGFFQGIFQNGERVEMYDMGCAAIVHVEGDCTVAITKVKMHNGGLSGHRVQKSCGFCPCPG